MTDNYDITLADEGKAYEQDFDDGVKAVLKDLIGHQLNDDGWTWTISMNDIQFVIDKYKVEISE